VTYVNKKGERSTLPLNHALESSNAEMTKRLKYTKDILTHMLNNNNKGGASTAPAMGGSGTGGGGTGSSSRPGTISSAVTSKRSVVQTAEGGMPSTIMGKTGGGTQSTTNILASDRRPLNVLN
jgi:hypothetical protein